MAHFSHLPTDVVARIFRHASAEFHPKEANVVLLKFMIVHSTWCSIAHKVLVNNARLKLDYKHTTPPIDFSIYQDDVKVKMMVYWEIDAERKVDGMKGKSKGDINARKKYWIKLFKGNEARWETLTWLTMRAGGEHGDLAWLNRYLPPRTGLKRLSLVDYTLTSDEPALLEKKAGPTLASIPKLDLINCTCSAPIVAGPDGLKTEEINLHRVNVDYITKLPETVTRLGFTTPAKERVGVFQFRTIVSKVNITHLKTQLFYLLPDTRKETYEYAAAKDDYQPLPDTLTSLEILLEGFATPSDAVVVAFQEILDSLPNLEKLCFGVPIVANGQKAPVVKAEWLARADEKRLRTTMYKYDPEEDEGIRVGDIKLLLL